MHFIGEGVVDTPLVQLFIAQKPYRSRVTLVDLACLRKVYLRSVEVLWTEKSHNFFNLNPIQRGGFSRPTLKKKNPSGPHS